MYSEFVYVLKAGPFYKIGRTTDVTKRIATLSIQLPFPVELFKVINTDDSADLENVLHHMFAKSRVNGEWFELTPYQAGLVFMFSPSCGMRFEADDLTTIWFDLRREMGLAAQE